MALGTHLLKPVDVQPAGDEELRQKIMKFLGNPAPFPLFRQNQFTDEGLQARLIMTQFLRTVGNLAF